MRIYDGTYQEFSKAYIVFEDSTTIWWLKFFKKGFRHCYIVFSLDEGGSWLEINPMSNRVLVCIRNNSHRFDYISYLQKSRGVTVLEVDSFKTPPKCAPFGIFTCVEFVKRTLGVHNFWVLTPYQLFNKIKNCRKKVLTL